MDKYADLHEGMPGSNFKYQKIKDLIEQRKSEVQAKRKEEREKRRLEKALERHKSIRGKKLAESRFHARKNSA